MSKRVRRAQQQSRRRSRTSRVRGSIQRHATTAPSNIRSSGRLLDRILAAPHVAHVVPRLQPEVLHRVIRHCGLEDCGELLALATPGQLARVFDLDLWRPSSPGQDERFDAARFGLWLEVMVDADVSNAATMLAAMDADLVAAGLVQHVRVFDYAAVASFVTLDGDLSQGFTFDDTLRFEVGGYVVSAMRREFWDAITAALTALAEAHGLSFNQIMRRCCRQSNSRPEVDGLDDLPTTNEQAIFDVALDREARLDKQGYVTPAQARAFLQMSRRIDRRHGAIPARDPVTSAYFRDIEGQTSIEPDDASQKVLPRDHVEAAQEAPAEAVTAIVDLLHDAGVIPGAPRALLESRQTSAPQLTRIQAHLQFAYDRDPDAYVTRTAELAYLANVLMAGTTVQARPVAEAEASNAAVAVCNLGLENWPVHWLAGEVRLNRAMSEARVELPEDFLIRQDLVRVFQVGWTVLHEDVCMYVADELVSVLASVHCADRDVQVALQTLRVEAMKHLRAGSPWDVRDALDVIAILDTPAWAALLGLLDQFPTLHAAVGASLVRTTRQIDPAAFGFISENRHIQQIRDFMQLLPAILRT
jgi:Family of unknown function (DUF6178)